MKKRCLNPTNKSYKSYGAVGISIYPAWIDNFDFLFEYINNTLPNLPEVCIMITDGYIEFPKEVPKYPVIWVLMNNTGTVPPFGSIIRVD
jgi:hypothetical protein